MIPEIDRQAIATSLLSRLYDLMFEVDGKEIYVDEVDIGS